jgi:hypothetical protein
MLAKQKPTSFSHFGTFDPIDHDLIRILTEFAQLISAYGYFVSIASRRGMEKLSVVSVEKKQMIISHYTQIIEWIRSEEVTHDPQNIDKICAQKALSYFNLNADDSFMNTITSEDVIEIYGHDMVQLYRSFNFFNLTSYSLLDMSVFEWYVLWERPKRAVESTMQDVEEVLKNYHTVRPFSQKRQLIREVYNTEVTQDVKFVPRAILAEFKNMGSLRSISNLDKTPKGFICNSTATVVAVGKESENIQFI